MEAAHTERGSGPATRRNGISNEMVAILSMGVAILGVSLASWTTLHAEIADLRLEMRAGDDRLRAELHSDMDRLRSDLQGQMARLRSDLQGQMDQLRSDLQGQMDQLRSDLQGQMEQLRADIGAVDQSVRRLDDRMRAVETRLAVVEAHTGSAAIASTGEGGEA